MPISKSIILIFFTTFALIACEKEKPIAKKPEEVYDWHNQKYQDFFAQYMRKQTIAPNTVNKDMGFSIDKKDFESSLGLTNLPNDLVVKIIVDRVKPEDNKLISNPPYKTKQELLDYFDAQSKTVSYLKDYAKGLYHDCEIRYQVDNLICLRNDNFSVDYYYLPTQSKPIPHVNQVIKFYCHTAVNSCSLTQRPAPPYNLDIWFNFEKPEYFFYIMPYADKHFYQTTGVHLWEDMPKKN